MNPPSPPGGERRRRRRLVLDKVRVRCVSGDFDDLSGDVNFARRLINVGLGGACIETTGRLRPDVKLTLEIRFDDIGSALRSKAQIIWVDTLTQGAAEEHRAGLRFIGPELTQPVRELLEGGQAAEIAARRRDEHAALKKQSESRKEEAGRRGLGRPAKAALFLLVLALGYFGSFWGLVLQGRIGTSKPISFSYSETYLEDAFARFYAPALWVFRKAGVEILYPPR